MPSDADDFSFFVDRSNSGRRLDSLVVSHLSDYSRSFVAHLINDGKVRVHGEIKKPSYKVKSGDIIAGVIPPPTPLAYRPEPIDLQVLFEDQHLIVINKQSGLVVHPAPGHDSGTLVNGLLHHCPILEGIGGKIRPGIVHRLDKDTSGAMVVAKNDAAHQHLSRQFKSRAVKKQYLALVYGFLAENSGTVTLPIGRHPTHRKKMSTTSRKTRVAETRWAVRERFDGITLLKLDLKTGRTHQIRVHCAAINHPVVGDPVYGGRRRLRMSDKKTGEILKTASRQMLHAWRLRFNHPVTDAPMSFEAPLPSDMAELIQDLRMRKASRASKLSVPDVT